MIGSTGPLAVSTVRRVGLQMEAGSWWVRRFVCQCCAKETERTSALVNQDGGPHAIYFANCYHHDGGHDVWIDAIFGTWGSNTVDDHVTFGCRVGPVAESPMPGATLVPGAAPYDDDPMFGRKLGRDEALSHPLLSDFWALVDFVLEKDRVVRKHVYGLPAWGGWRTWWWPRRWVRRLP